MRATREGSRVALVTDESSAGLHEDDHPLRDALTERGVRVDAVRWDDPAADWAAYDLVVIRTPWDYTRRPAEFVAWAHAVPRLVNPADVVEWNTDKHYLRDLAEAGLPVAPTGYIEPDESWNPPPTGEWVVKPTISAGSRNTGRYSLPADVAPARAHVTRLSEAGHTVMIQPYLPAIDTVGETSVLCLPDATGELTYSHAVRKAALLTARGERTSKSAGVKITAHTPTEPELELARHALTLVPGGSKRLLYARVDMLPGPDGAPLLLELELTEPFLFFREAPAAPVRMAEAILARL